MSALRTRSMPRAKQKKMGGAACERPTLEAYIAALVQGDAEAARKLVELELAGGMSVEDVYLELLLRAQREIGALWQAGELNVADEHLATHITMEQLTRLKPLLARKRTLGMRAMVGTSTGELHVLPARVIADFLHQDGWDVDFLGTGAPLPDLLQCIRRRKPRLLALSFTMADCLAEVEALVRSLAKEAWRPKLLVGGSALKGKERWALELGVDAVGSDAPDAVDQARRICRVPAPERPLEEVLLALGRSIQQQRKARGMSQADLSEAAHLDRAYISSIEHGRQNVTVAALLRISAALGVPFEGLVTAAARIPLESGGTTEHGA